MCKPEDKWGQCGGYMINSNLMCQSEGKKKMGTVWRLCDKFQPNVPI